MRLLGLLVACIVSVATPAHAMGRYVNFEVIAWNADGTAVILGRSETSSGTAGITQQYILIGAREPDALTVSFNDTQDPDTASQKIDRATCLRTAATFRTALAAHRFRGVTIRANRCKTDRAVLQLAGTTGELVNRSLVDLSTRRPTSLRELAAQDARNLVLGEDDDPGTIMSLTGALTVVLFGGNGDSSGPGHAIAIATTPTGPRAVGGDLRN